MTSNMKMSGNSIHIHLFSFLCANNWNTVVAGKQHTMCSLSQNISPSPPRPQNKSLTLLPRKKRTQVKRQLKIPLVLQSEFRILTDIEPNRHADVPISKDAPKSLLLTPKRQVNRGTSCPPTPKKQDLFFDESHYPRPEKLIFPNFWGATPRSSSQLSANAGYTMSLILPVN